MAVEEEEEWFVRGMMMMMMMMGHRKLPFLDQMISV